jgi:hypothetical protein
VFTPIPSECTGRFADVTGGGFTMVAVTDPFDPTPNAKGYTMPFNYSWEGEGMIVERASHVSLNTDVPFVPLPLTFAAPSVVAPFETAGAGHGPQGLPLFAGGMASQDATGGINLLDTYHGKYSGPGEFTLLNFTGPTTGNFQGTFDFVASNGDQLPCTYGAGSPGTFTIIPAANGKVVVQFIAEFAPITSEATGRFANVSGGNFMMIATTDPFDPTPNAQGFTGPLTYSWLGAGLFLENITSHRDIIGLSEFGKHAAAFAAFLDQGDGHGHWGPEQGLLLTGEERREHFAAPFDQSAVSHPFVSAFNSPHRLAEPYGPEFHPPLAGGGNPMDVDELFSAQNRNPFGIDS